MALKVLNTALPDVLLVEPDVFEDSRGFFMEQYNKQKYDRAGISRVFVQDNYSQSCRGVLRGMHFQHAFPQAKLVFVPLGEVFDVAVDIRRGSPTFGKWTGQLLSGDNKRQMFIPEGFAHGFCVLSETAHFCYKCTEFYHPEDDRGIMWNDPAIGIDWPVDDPVVSPKDSAHPALHDVPGDRLPSYT